MSLPPVVEGLLLDVVADGFVVYCCGDRSAPNALAASYEWERCIDLLTIHNFDTITVARVPKQGTVDIFAPEVVIWAYEGPPQQALRALLDLAHPAHPDAPTAEHPAPPSLHIPRTKQRPMTIRLPSSGRAATRATRLTTKTTDDLAISAVTSTSRGRMRRELDVNDISAPADVGRVEFTAVTSSVTSSTDLPADLVRPRPGGTAGLPPVPGDPRT